VESNKGRLLTQILIILSNENCFVEAFCMEGPTIKSESFKEIIIMEQTRFKTVDDLARFANIAVGGKTTGVYWAKGVVFIYYPLPTSTEAAAKALIEERKVYWAFVSYALMPQYRSIIETKERIMVPVIDMSTSTLFQKVAQWLKEQT
jgi:hypothetical protein